MNFFSKEGLKYKKFGASAPSSRGTRRDLGTRSLHRIHPLTMSLSLFSPAKLQRRLDWIRHQSEPFFPGTQVLCYTSATRRVLLLCIVVGTAQRGCRDACFMTVVLPLFFLTTAAGGRKTLRCSLVCVRTVSAKRLSLKKILPFFFSEKACRLQPPPFWGSVGVALQDFIRQICPWRFYLNMHAATGS